MIRFVNKIKSVVRTINNLERNVNYQQCAHLLTDSALTNDASLVSPIKNAATQTIISVTTYGKRLYDVYLVIESIARQSVKPNRIILWLDEDEYQLSNLPQVIINQQSRGLEVRFCKNYRSYKKLVPTLKLCPNANIITLDDDIIYPFDMIEMLLKEHQKSPKCIIGHRAHKILKDKSGRILPYLDWELSTKSSEPSHEIFVTTGGGTLFPPHSLAEEACNEDLFLTLSPNADDVWFKVMAAKKGTMCKVVADERQFFERFYFIPASQDIGLSNQNVHEHQNDIQLKKVLAYFDFEL